MKVRKEFDNYGNRLPDTNEYEVGDFSNRQEFSRMCGKAVDQILGGKDAFNLNCVVIEAYGPDVEPVASTYPLFYFSTQYFHFWS